LSDYKKDHPFFSDSTMAMFQDMDDCFAYAIAFSEDILSKHLNNFYFKTAEEWCAADQAFRYKVKAAQIILRQYVDLMRDEASLFPIDYDLRGEFKARSKSFIPFPNGTFCIDARGLPSEISSSLSATADNTSFQFFFRQSTFFVHAHMSDTFQALCRAIDSRVRSSDAFEIGSAEANKYILYSMGTIFHGGTSQHVAYELGMPIPVDVPPSHYGTERTRSVIAELKKQAGITP
jgi:hypothetical protein